MLSWGPVNREGCPTYCGGPFPFPEARYFHFLSAWLGFGSLRDLSALGVWFISADTCCVGALFLPFRVRRSHKENILRGHLNPSLVSVSAPDGPLEGSVVWYA